jgi:5'-nucleotidase
VTYGGDTDPVRLVPSPPLILVTNDDGIHAPGLLALARALRPLGEVAVVAPARNRTGSARSITMDGPLWVEEVDLPGGISGLAIEGTPVDCVRMAALGLLERPPDLIVSGINHGANMGDDITYSGTVAAALEGIVLDIPSLAVSADGRRDEYDFSAAARVAARLIAAFLERGFPARTLLNVNCPDLPFEQLRGARLTSLGTRIYGDRADLQSVQGRRREYLIYGDDLSYHPEAGSDFEAVGEGYVSVTPLHFELTAREALDFLRRWDLSLDEPGPGSEPVVPAPRAVIFDLDGTVVDSVELIVESFRHATETVLGQTFTRQEMIANVGKPLLEQMALIDAERADELVRVYREFNHREHDRMLSLYSGMDHLIRALRAQGVRVGLVTSKSRPTTQMAFDLTGIEPLFHATVCYEDTERNKPHPEPIEHCAGLLGIPVAEAAYIGDSPYDLQAARSAGVWSVGVSWGVFGEDVLLAERPDRMAHTVEELARILGLRPGWAQEPGPET